MSSAEIVSLLLETAVETPSIKIVKSSGPRIDHWGTPDYTGSTLDLAPIRTTDCSLSVKKSLIHLNKIISLE